MADTDLLGDFNGQENNYSSEEFEKLDKPDQDEEVSSSFADQHAAPEEDRYEAGTDSSNLLNFGDDVTPQDPPKSEPLINFGSSSVAEPSAPPVTSFDNDMMSMRGVPEPTHVEETVYKEPAKEPSPHIPAPVAVSSRPPAGKHQDASAETTSIITVLHGSRSNH